MAGVRAGTSVNYAAGNQPVACNFLEDFNMDILERIAHWVGKGKTPQEAEKIAQDEAQAEDLEGLGEVGEVIQAHRDGCMHDAGIDGSVSSY